MAYRKYKPALYEMLDHRSVKTTKKGGVATPRWFYAGRTAAAEPETVSEAEQTEPLPPAPKQIEKKTDLLTGPNRIELSVTRQLLILVGVGLLLTHLAAFMLGHGSGGSATESSVQEATAGGLPSLQSVRESPIQEGIYPQRPERPPVEQRPSQAKADVRAVIEKPQLRTVAPAVVQNDLHGSVENGICLVLCTYQRHRELRPVQSYFNQKGIRTEIGKLGSNYVLYSRSAFENSSDRRLRALKDAVRDLGRGENGRGVHSFTPETFAGAYTVNVDRINKIDTP
jgi:hypothetical protein